MLLEKCEPKTITDMIGNVAQSKEIKKWIQAWKKGSALLLYGPTGCGKSLSVKRKRPLGEVELQIMKRRDNKTRIENLKVKTTGKKK